MTRDEVEGFARMLGRPAGDVALAATSINETGIREAVDASVTWERWDRESPINGVPAEMILPGRDDLQGAEAVYLIVVDGQVQQMQGNVPDLADPITEANLVATAEAHRAQVVQLETDRQLAAAIAAVLNA